MTYYGIEQVLPVDIDETLLLWGKIPKGAKAVHFTDPYSKDQKTVRIHEANVKILTNHIARGTLIVAWSKSGPAWARAAFQALNLSHHKNIIVIAKPIGYLDDKPCQDWMGEQVYLPIDSAYGK